MQPRLTFAIPYYSQRDYLVRAIESVLRQRMTHWNLLVLDDSPVDEQIQDLVASYGDPRMRCCRNPSNLGLAGNWNRCLQEPSSELVTILHADDELLENYGDFMLQAAQDYPEAVGYFCEAVIINERGKRILSVPDLVKRFIRPRSQVPVVLSGPQAVASLLRGNSIVCPTMCYRRSRLDGRQFDARWKFVLDLDLFTRLLLDGEQLVGIPETAYTYRRHSQSETARQTITLNRFREEIDFHRYHAVTARARGLDVVTAAAEATYMIRLNLLYCVLRDLSRFRFGDASRKLRLLSGAA